MGQKPAVYAGYMAVTCVTCAQAFMNYITIYHFGIFWTHATRAADMQTGNRTRILV